ncbi:MAG: lauroyl acyltransferase [Beijerinckiaceae bacterium]|nr:lauroyl acyltransferase [Beijerinckiaceae bacterium]
MSLTASPSPSFSDRLLYPLEAAGFAAIAGLTRALPVDQASALSGAAWRRFAPLNRRHARAAQQLAASLPELDEVAREAILDGMWDNLGRTTAESFHIDEILSDPRRIETDAGFDHAVAQARRHGAVFVTLHLGNWELCAPIMTRAGIDVTGVYQRIKNPHVDAAVIQLRSQYYRGGLHAKSAEAAREILRVAARKGMIGLLGDLRDFRGESVPFFGRPAPSSTFPALVARQRDIPLFIAKVMRLENVRFRAVVVELPIIRTDDRQADLRTMTAQIQQQFERWIRETPAQWMWGHRRWG